MIGKDFLTRKDRAWLFVNEKDNFMFYIKNFFKVKTSDYGFYI